MTVDMHKFHFSGIEWSTCCIPAPATEMEFYRKPKPRKENSRLPVNEMPLVGKSIQWPSVMASVNAHFEMLHWTKLIGS